MAGKGTSSSSLRGALDLMVLGVLEDEPLHGYAIAQTIRSRAGGDVRVEEGSLYPALYRMEGRGWVRASWGRNDNNRRVRVYTITTDGRKHLEQEREDWRTFARAVAKVAGTGGR